MIQVGYDGDWPQGRGSGGGQKWSSSGYILKVLLTSSVNDWMWVERIRGIKNDSRGVGLSTW